MNENETLEFCSTCHIGSLKPSRATYARWHDEKFILLPGIPAWHCDYCGETFYDNDFMVRLTLLLGPELESGDQQMRRATGRDENWSPELGDRHRFG